MSDKQTRGVGFARDKAAAGPRTGEVDRAVIVCVHLVDHILQLGLAGVLAERSHDCS